MMAEYLDLGTHLGTFHPSPPQTTRYKVLDRHDQAPQPTRTLPVVLHRGNLVNIKGSHKHDAGADRLSPNFVLGMALKAFEAHKKP